MAQIPHEHAKIQDYETCPIVVGHFRINSNGKETREWYVEIFPRYRKQDDGSYVATEFHAFRKNSPPKCTLPRVVGRWSEPVVWDYVAPRAAHFPESYTPFS